VLHTWGQNLQHHPHIHCLVPGGGLSPDGRRWVSCRPGFFLPVRVLSRLFRRLFLEKLRAAFDAGRLAFFGALAGLYVLLDAPFTAVTQIIIYTGAIMVLFLFVVMLLNVNREEPAPPGLIAALQPGSLKIAAVLSVVLGVEIVWTLSRISLTSFAADPAAQSVSDVSRIGVALFTRHAFAFEATSILILVAMVGAIIIARKERQS
jgi:NADH:ubiquinone oxidoreductase subunit 6 (subunit J)